MRLQALLKSSGGQEATMAVWANKNGLFRLVCGFINGLCVGSSTSASPTDGAAGRSGAATVT